MSGTVWPSYTLPTNNAAGLQRIYDKVQTDVPGVVLPVIQQELWSTIEDFYIESTFERRLVNWQLAVGAQQLNFDPYDANWNVAWVLNVGGLSQWRVHPPGTVVDLTNPVSVRTGTALLALRPNSFNVVFPQTLFHQWFETIVAGVLARLYGTPAKPYSNPQLAQFHARAYRAGRARARDIAQREYSDGRGRWCFPYFSAGRRKS